MLWTSSLHKVCIMELTVDREDAVEEACKRKSRKSSSSSSSRKS